MVQAMGMLQQEFAAGSREIVRQLERGNRMEESKTSDRASVTGISREDTITMFIMKGSARHPQMLRPALDGIKWYRAMRHMVVDDRQGICDRGTPVKPDHYVLLACALVSWGKPRHGDSAKVTLDVQHFAEITRPELSDWLAPHPGEYALTTRSVPVTKFNVFQECAARLVAFLGMVYGPHHCEHIYAALGQFRTWHYSNPDVWSCQAIAFIFSVLLHRYFTDWRQLAREVIQMTRLEDPSIVDVARVCNTLRPGGAPLIAQPRI